MFLLYDLIFLIFTLIYLPIYLFKGKFHDGFLRRFGVLPEGLNLDRPIWIHAVSLGEAISIRGLIEGLHKIYPHKKFVISTVTPTGNKIARASAKEGDFVTYLPLDFSFTVKRVMNRIDPCLFIIAETEIWPNLINYLFEKGIPIITVNGRISDASFKGYCVIKFLLSSILNKVSLFCMQSQVDADRLSELGVTAGKIKVTGNMKFDKSDYRDFEKDYTDYRLKLGLVPEEKLLVAGSTHPGEEEIILSVYRKLLDRFSNFRLLIAPRHPERAGEVEKAISKNGFNAERVSRLASVPVSGLNLIPLTRSPAHPQTIFILDTVGNLLDCYAAADIVFVGGSLIKKGGHNILEPACCGKPVIFGLYMFNFRDITKLFLEHNAGIMARSKEDLEFSISELLANTLKADKLVENAKRVIACNQGATARNIEAIKLMGVCDGD